MNKQTKSHATKLLAIGCIGVLSLPLTAQTATSPVVGYETLTIANGFNYLGLRLHEKVIASGDLETISSASVTDSDADFSTLAAGTYVLEITDGSGIVQEVSAFASGTQISTSDDLSSAVPSGATYNLRAASTLASVFGANNEAGLDSGFAGTVGADQVWLVNGTDFDRYYYDTFNASTFVPAWVRISDGAIVDPSTITMFYTDGFIIVGDGTANNQVVVSGAVKTTNTEYALMSSFNYLSSVSPAGATLASTFGANNESGLGAGFGGTVGADQVWIPNGTDFDRYYYDTFNASTFAATWTDAGTGSPVTASAISLDNASGVIIINDGAAQNTLGTVPDFY